MTKAKAKAPPKAPTNIALADQIRKAEGLGCFPDLVKAARLGERMKIALKEVLGGSPSPSPSPAVTAGTEKRGPGRPPGSKNVAAPAKAKAKPRKRNRKRKGAAPTPPAPTLENQAPVASTPVDEQAPPSGGSLPPQGAEGFPL